MCTMFSGTFGVLSVYIHVLNAHTCTRAQACSMGEGGSIPFMGMLGKKFPQAQFAIVGVLGPKSNAHGPNEFIHIDFTKKLMGCVAGVVADHYKHFTGTKKRKL